MPRFYPTVELALGADLTATPSSWSWTDNTAYVHNPSQITIQRGRQNQYAQTAPGTCSLAFRNDDGRFTPRNPVGAHYGTLARNTPLRVLIRPNVNSASDTFGRSVSSGWGTADVGGAWTNTGGSASDFSVTSGVGRHAHPNVLIGHYTQLAASVLRVDLKVRVRANALSTGGSQSAGVICRFVDSSNHRRAELQFATSGAITARLVQRAAGTDTVNASVTTGLTHSTSAWYWIRLQTGLTSARVRVWLDGTTEPATWLIDGSTGVFTGTAIAGTFGCWSRRESSNTNVSATLDFDDFTMVDGPRVQFTGFVDQWPVRWNDPGMGLALAPITASGQLRQVGLQQTLRSALFRAHTLQTYAVTPTAVAYWPMEDADASESFASGIGGRPLFFDDMSPHADSSIVGSDPLPTAGGGAVFYADVPIYAAATSWAVRVLLKLPASPSAATGLLAWTTSGTAVRWVLELTPGSPDVLRLRAYNSAGSELLSDSGISFVDTSAAELLARQVYIEVNATQNGGNIDWNFTVWFGSNGSGSTGSVAATIGNVTRLVHSAYPGLTAGGYTVGHIAVATDTGYGASSNGVTGYAGESTDTRFTRLCTEQQISPFFGDIVLGSGTTIQKMGPQTTTSLQAQLREVEATEVGILYDGKQGQMHVLPRTMRQNPSVTLTLDVSQHQVGWPLDPTDDDYLLRNDITVSRVGGSSARATDTASVRQVGAYADSATINSQSDTDLPNHASWRLSVGTIEELRYPQVVVDLTRNHLTLANSWLDCDIGSRMQITHVPSDQLPPDDLDLLVEGYTEIIDSMTWTVGLNTSPARPWKVFTLEGGGNLGRVGSSGSTLNAGVTSSAASISVATPTGSLWRTGAVNFDLEIAGERVTVTNISGSSSPQTFTVTRSVNGVVKAQAANAEVKLWKPGVLAL